MEVTKATILLHLKGLDNYDIIDIVINDLRYKELESLYKRQELIKEKKRTKNELIKLSKLMDIAEKELNGNTTKAICKELWNHNKKEDIYCLQVDILIEDDQIFEKNPYIGYRYFISNIKFCWERLNILQRGDNIYQKINGKTINYTIDGITQNHVNPGIWYMAYQDDIPLKISYSYINYNEINKNIYFSSKEIMKKNA